MKKRLTRPDRPSAAYHEAGHAVACVVLGVRLSWVKIDEGDFGGGDTAHSGYEEDSPRERIESLLIINYAGEIAEHWYRGRAGLARDRVGAQQDRLDAERLLHRAGGYVWAEDTQRAYQRYLRLRARDLVDHYAMAIEVVAAELLKPEVVLLTGDQVVALVSRIVGAIPPAA